MKPFLYIRMTKENKETIEKALTLMNYDNKTDVTMNDLVEAKMLKWAKRYLRNYN